MALTVHSRALQRAADVLGGKERLREYLRVREQELVAWLDGTREAPTHVFLKAVDVISSHSAELVRSSRTSVVRIEQDFLHADFAPEEGRSMVESAIDAALVAGRARKGNLQLHMPDGLRIVAHRGFHPPFLDYFAHVSDAAAVCGRAMASARRVVVPDIATDPIASTAAGAILREADVRAVQSTPIVAGSGELLGMISTHYEVPLQDGGVEFDMLDRIAARAAYWLEGNLAQGARAS